MKNLLNLFYVFCDAVLENPHFSEFYLYEEMVIDEEYAKERNIPLPATETEIFMYSLRNSELQMDWFNYDELLIHPWSWIESEFTWTHIYDEDGSVQGENCCLTDIDEGKEFPFFEDDPWTTEEDILSDEEYWEAVNQENLWAEENEYAEEMGW